MQGSHKQGQSVGILAQGVTDGATGEAVRLFAADLGDLATTEEQRWRNKGGVTTEEEKHFVCFGKVGLGNGTNTETFRKH